MTGAHRLSTDRGSATGWAIGTMLIGLLLAALVFDGAAAMTARASAVQVAQQAARAGADQLDLAALRETGDVRLDPAAAETAAHDFLDRVDVTDTTASATAEQVTVTVTVTTPTVLLAAVGIDTFTVAATATAEPVQP